MISTPTCPLQARDAPPADPVASGVPAAGCLLCGARFSDVVWRENGYEGRGTPCGLVYLEPRPAPDAVRPEVELHGDGYYARNAALRLDFVQRFAPAGRLLEVGCGAGHLLAEARRRGYDVAGVDPSAACVEHVRRVYGIPVEQAVVEETRLPEGAWDVVFHVDLLSHFPDPVRALRAMAARVRPGGFVCFEVGILGGMSPLWYAMTGRLDFPEHRWLFSERTLRELLRRAGLEVVDVRRYGLLASVLLLGARQLVAPARARRTPRPPRQDHAAAPSAAARLNGWVQHLARYRMGRWMPRVGPLTLLVAARPAAEGSAHG